MNRELKFRAFYQKKLYMQEYFGGFSYFIHNDSDALSLEDIFVAAERQKCIIQQYTGLKDKNGKEIYEGDILKHRKRNKEVRIGEFWDGVDDRTGVFLQDPKIDHRNFGTNRLSSFSSCEVIGNIFENPELLEH
jgi:uncharacterized phage protein (TIGR01671 family)